MASTAGRGGHNGVQSTHVTKVRWVHSGLRGGEKRGRDEDGICGVGI